MLDWSPDGTKVAAVCLTVSETEYDSFIQVMDAASGKTVLTIVDSASLALAQAVAWSPDGTRLLTTGGSDEVGTRYNPVIIWDAATGEKLLSIIRHTGQVYWGSWSPDGTRIVTGSTDGTTRMWDAETGAELLTLTTPSNWSVVPEWSPTGDLLAVSRYSTGIPSNPAEVWRVWQSTDELIAYAYDCCVFRDLTAEEREQFGLSER